MTLKYEYDLKGLHYLVRVEDRVLRPFDIYVDGKIVEHGAGEIEVEHLEYEWKDFNCMKDLILKAYTTEKPPLGVKPCFIAAEMRIKELVKGIERQLDNGSPDHKLIKRWASEIVGQCDLIEDDEKVGR